MLSMKINYAKTKYFQLEVRDASENLVDLTGKTLRFSVKKNFEAADPALIDKATGTGITHAASQSTTGKGLATLKILPTDTSTLLGSVAATDSPSMLYCQLELLQAVGEPEVLDSGYFTIEPSVRRSV